MGTSRTFIIASLLSAVVTAGCKSDTSNPTPKPSAYHRIELPDSTFTTLHILNVAMPINSATSTEKVSKDGSEWLTVGYPQFPGVKMYLTLTATDRTRFDELLRNRQERISLNVGSSTTEVTELTSDGGWNCALFVTKNSVTTPIQLLASNPSKTRLLSGAVHIERGSNLSVTPDSIAPIVTTCARDLLTTLKHIADK